jgi:hypothetical protein
MILFHWLNLKLIKACRLNDNIKTGYELLKKKEQIQENGYIFTSNQSTVISVQYVNRKLKMLAAKSIFSYDTLVKLLVVQRLTADPIPHFMAEFLTIHPSTLKRYLGIRQEELDDICHL